MCGIAGFVNKYDPSDERESAATLERMCHVIRHRGPDDQGMMIEPGVALGMRRLSIIDLAGGRQPISGEDGKVTVVFNGEIYNFRELQTLLEARGHSFRTRSDTEAIVHAYEEFGPASVEHFRGMFAFAAWDSRDATLFLARDRVGKKPLYYTLTDRQTLVFGSELKSLFEHPEVAREIDYEALDAYLAFGYVPDPLTIIKGIYKLPPGCHLSFKSGRVTVTPYWDFSFEPAGAGREEDYIEELRALLDDAVKVRLISDVPLGAFLSGGIDSSAVVGLMARHSSRPVKTFSIGFNEDTFSELKYARVAAEHFGTDHHEFIVTPDVCRVVDELVWHLDEPFSDPSVIPTYMVSKLARRHVTVALSGDGGDELFAGYTRYVTHRRRDLFSALPGRARRLFQPLSRRLPHGARGRNYLYNVSLDPLDRYIDSLSVFTDLGKDSLYSPDLKMQLAGAATANGRFQECAGRVRTDEQLDALLYLDSKTYLPGDILTKVDRMSMAVSLEARAPLLDYKLIEFVTRIPARLKMNGLETKSIFKRAARGLVPDATLDRRKQGFGLPLQQWINQELRDYIRDTLTDRKARERGYFDPGYVDLLFDEHSRNRRDHSKQLWTLFMLELWHRACYEPVSYETGIAPRGTPDVALRT